jgi:hypothetical protein
LSNAAQVAQHAELEKLGPERVQILLSNGELQALWRPVAIKWLAEKHRISSGKVAG